MLGSHLSFREVKIRSLTATSTCTSGAPLDDWWSWCQWRRWRLLGVLYSFSNALTCSRVFHTWAWEWPSSSLDCHHVLRAGVHLRDNLLWPGRHCLTSYLERFRLWWIPLFLRCWWRPRLWTSLPAIQRIKSWLNRFTCLWVRDAGPRDLLCLSATLFKASMVHKVTW